MQNEFHCMQKEIHYFEIELVTLTFYYYKEQDENIQRVTNYHKKDMSDYKVSWSAK